MRWKLSHLAHAIHVPSGWTDCCTLPGCKPIFPVRMKASWGLSFLLSCYLESQRAELEGPSETIYGHLVLLGENEVSSAGKCGRGKSAWCVVSDLVLILTLHSLSMWCFPKHYTLPALFFSSVKAGINSYLPGVGNMKWGHSAWSPAPNRHSILPWDTVNTLMHFISILLPWQFFKHNSDHMVCIKLDILTLSLSLFP